MKTILFKVLLLGDASVGKTSSIKAYMDQKLKRDYIATIGVDVSTIKIPIEDKSDKKKKKENVTLTVWDLAGQNQFQNIRQNFYLGANIGILIFDVTRKDTFEDLEDWIKEVEGTITHQLPFFLVGNKIDLPERVISQEEIAEFADNHDQIILTHETSALTGKGIRELFHLCAEIIYNGEKALVSQANKKPKADITKSSKKTTKKASKKITKKTAKKTASKKSTKKAATKSTKKTAKGTSKKKKAGKKTKKK